MMAVDLNFLPISGKEEFFTHFLQQKKNLLFPLSTEEQIQIENFVTVMWSVLQEPVFRKVNGIITICQRPRSICG
jgi:hypothetical protein